MTIESKPAAPVPAAPVPAAPVHAAPAPADMAPPRSVGAAVVHGTAWMVAMRWSVRGLGLVNTFILARLLAPSDFGIVAMAMLVIQLIEALGQSGQLLALIRHPNPSRAHYDSVWTLSIIVAATLTAVMVAASPLASLYFHEPRAGAIMRILALRTLVGGFDNVGVVAFRKNLAFGREFTYQVLQKLASLGATVAFAVVLRDYWALVGGLLLGRCLMVGLSYRMSSYRPRLSVAKIPELISFSGWMLVLSMAQFLQDKADQLVLGSFASAQGLGTYNVASDVATSPTIEVVLPMTRALFPIFARIAGDTAKLRTAFLDVFGGAAIICCASATGVALVAADFVAVTLGPKWTQAVPLVEILGFAGGFYGIMHSGITLLSATGHARLCATLSSTRTACMFPALIAAGLLGDVQAIAWARLVVTAAFVPGIFVTLSRVLPITVGDIARRVWRPVLAAAAMAAVVRMLHPGAVPSAAFRLFADALVGAAAYAATLMLLWELADRPPGAEAAALARARALLPRLSVFRLSVFRLSVFRVAPRLGASLRRLRPVREVS